MIRKPSDTQTIGLDLEKTALKTAVLETIRGKVQIKRLEAYSLNEEGHFITDKEAQQCHEQCEKFLSIGCLNGNDVLIRKLKIKLVQPKDVEAAFPFEAEGQLPFPSEEAYLDKIVVETADETTHLTMLAAKKTAVKKQLSEFHDLKIEPEILTTTPHALAAFEGAFGDTPDEVLVLYLGQNESLIAKVIHGKLLSSHSLNVGVESLEASYKQDKERLPELLEDPFQEFDFGSDDLDLSPHLKEALSKYKHDINWMILSELKGAKNPLPIMLVGEGATLKGLDDQLFKELNLNRVEIKASEGMEMNLNLLRRFAIAIGSALTALPNYPHPINFRQGDMEYPNPWRRYKATLGIFVGASLMLAAMIFIFGLAYLGYKEDFIRENYSQLIADTGKTFKGFEEEISQTETPVDSLKDLSMSELRTRMEILEKQINNEPDLFPLYPQVPTVTDTLAWLNGLPQMQGEDGKITIDSFNYTMVKRPEANKRNEKYQVKVDVELSAPTPKMARELHTALIQPNDFIDAKGEVKWSSSKGKYRTSFYLKDKTPYLSGSGQ